MKWFTRADGYGNHNNDQLQHGLDRVDVYDSSSDNWTNWGAAKQSAVDELTDRGGGFIHNENGDAFKFVAPIPRK